jgi:hypothetical protein
MHQGLPCSEEKVSICDASQCCPPSYCNDLLLMRNSSYEGEHTCDDMHVLFKLNDLIEDSI